jgi:hypothetical protein
MSDPHQRWPADRFFWSVLDAPGVRADKGLPAGLLPLLQEDLPVPVEDVHAVGAATPDGRLLVCAAKREELRELPPSTLALCPDDVPALVEPKIDASAFNLLVADLEPAPLRRERARRRTLLALTAAAVACLTALGLARRSESCTKAGQEARAASAAVTTNPITLHNELDRLRKAPRVEAKAITTPDAAVALAALLSAWPKELECQTESVSVGPATMTLSLTVAKDARPFLSALQPPEGWTLDEPRLTATSDGARLHLTLHRKEARS